MNLSSGVNCKRETRMELTLRDVLPLTPGELQEVFASKYIDDLFDGRHIELSAAEIVDMTISLGEVGHPRLSNAVAPDKRSKMITNLAENAKSGMIRSGTQGVEAAMYHSITMITRYMLATETRLTRVK
jgi:hypothetical protein